MILTTRFPPCSSGVNMRWFGWESQYSDSAAESRRSVREYSRTECEVGSIYVLDFASDEGTSSGVGDAVVGI